MLHRAGAALSLDIPAGDEAAHRVRHDVQRLVVAGTQSGGGEPRAERARRVLDRCVDVLVVERQHEVVAIREQRPERGGGHPARVADDPVDEDHDAAGRGHARGDLPRIVLIGQLTFGGRVDGGQVRVVVAQPDLAAHDLLEEDADRPAQVARSRDGHGKPLDDDLRLPVSTSCMTEREPELAVPRNGRHACSPSSSSAATRAISAASRVTAVLSSASPESSSALVRPRRSGSAPSRTAG